MYVKGGTPVQKGVPPVCRWYAAIKDVPTFVCKEPVFQNQKAL